jgi:hypothetical protein
MACRSFSLRSKKQSVASLRWMEMTSLDEVAIGCIELASKRIAKLALILRETNLSGDR